MSNNFDASPSDEILKEISVFAQLFPPKPTFTEDCLSSLSGKTILITGATSGVGLEVAKIAYAYGADVNITGRTIAKLDIAMKTILAGKLAVQAGTVTKIVLDLVDFTNVRESAASFLQSNTRLDVLIHNAGIMKPPKGSKTEQGYDLEMGTNCVGPNLFNRLLEPIMVFTASKVPANSVRIIWVASMVAVGTPRGGICFDKQTGRPQVLPNAMANYMQSKLGNVFLASETGRRLKSAGIVSISVHPGVLNTELNRNAPKFQRQLMSKILHPAVNGAYTELFAAFSPEITIQSSGGLIVPWGRLCALPSQIEKGLRSKDDGGTGLAKKFADWCDMEVASYRDKLN